MNWAMNTPGREQPIGLLQSTPMLPKQRQSYRCKKTGGNRCIARVNSPGRPSEQNLSDRELIVVLCVALPTGLHVSFRKCTCDQVMYQVMGVSRT